MIKRPEISRPGSLFRRHAVLLAIVLVASQILSLALYSRLMLGPQIDRVVGTFADMTEVVLDSAAIAPAETRAEIIALLDGKPHLQVYPGGQEPPASDRRVTILERAFMRALLERLGAERPIDWGRGAGRSLWLHVDLGGEPYWISVRGPEGFTPRGTLAMIALVVGMLAVVAGLALSSQISRPLKALQSAADKVSLGTAPEPLEVKGSTEITALAESFNRMTRRLEEAESDRAFVLAGVSHDLRTPLAKLRLAVEMMPGDDDLRATSVRQIERMDRLLRQFLDFARGFEAEPIREIDIGELARQAAMETGEPGVEIRAPDVPVLARVRPEALRRAVVNLIENAALHGAAPIRVTVDAAPPGFSIVVRDSGPGMAPQLMRHATVAFRRGDLAQGQGSGLGLAIVERIARIHGGSLKLATPPQGGLEVRLDLEAGLPAAGDARAQIG